MTDERINQIRERLEASTHGPWEVFPIGNGLANVISPEPSGPGVTVAQKVGVEWTGHDAEFIANAPADIAYLLERLERLRVLAAETVKEVRAIGQAWREDWSDFDGRTLRDQLILATDRLDDAALGQG